MKVLALTALLMTGGPSLVGTAPGNSPEGRQTMPTLVGFSCSPRKTCSRTVQSCDEAYWLLENCSWGHKLDGDSDGVPCENLCSGG